MIIDNFLFSVPDGPPEKVHCVALTPTTIQVSWHPPESHLRNGVIKGYKVFKNWMKQMNFQNQFNKQSLKSISRHLCIFLKGFLCSPPGTISWRAFFECSWSLKWFAKGSKVDHRDHSLRKPSKIFQLHTSSFVFYRRGRWTIVENYFLCHS